MEIEIDSALHLINGVEEGSADGREFVTLDPSTGQELARVAFGGAPDVERAVTAAQQAQDSGEWSMASPMDRARPLRRLAALIREHSDAIARVESLDTGKPTANSGTEVSAGADFFDFYAGLTALPDGRTHPVDPGYFAYSRREPYGVVGAIAPWNYPFVLACWKTAPALAAGNSVVLKMAEQTPLSTTLLGRLTVEAGLPDGVFNIVHGDGPTTGAALVDHPGVPKITFTGSTSTGRAIMHSAADQIKSVHLELGGKTPNIILDDADIDAAISGSLFTAFSNTGQICTSGSRLLVDERQADEVVSRLVERAGQLRIGSPFDAGTQVGPLISAAQRESVSSYIDSGLEDGAHLALGGGRPADVDPEGYFIEPSIFVDVTPDMRIAQEEIFGPVLSVMTFRDEEEAVRIANSVMYGLSATIWTSDIGRAFRMANRIQAGIIWTNCPHYLPINVPYEGHKLSGLGEDLGVEAMHEFTQLKTHIIRYEAGGQAWD